MTENPFLRGGRRTFRYVVWRLGPDFDRKPAYLVFCEGEDDDGRPCGADSGECSELETAQGFPFEHAKRHPEHRSYGELSYRPLIMFPQEEPA
ncbi:DUF7848 domain-containing protein [Kitasatospora sp. NPDC001095]